MDHLELVYRGSIVYMYTSLYFRSNEPVVEIVSVWTRLASYLQLPVRIPPFGKFFHLHSSKMSIMTHENELLSFFRIHHRVPTSVARQQYVYGYLGNGVPGHSTGMSNGLDSNLHGRRTYFNGQSKHLHEPPIHWAEG